MTRAALLVVVPWFLWSTAIPKTAYYEKDLRATPVHEYKSRDECRQALRSYQEELNKTEDSLTFLVKLECSPVSPR